MTKTIPYLVFAQHFGHGFAADSTKPIFGTNLKKGVITSNNKFGHPKHDVAVRGPLAKKGSRADERTYGHPLS